jgi:NTP pyrophosphatase (non-canonical NTP hydrolase)
MNNQQPSLQELTEQLIDFRDARDWRQFHSLKDLILSLSLEASELLELSQWKPEKQFEDEALNDESMQQRLKEECADVLLYLLLIAERAGIDLQEAASNKLAANNEKYPVEKSRGTSAKYTKL